MFPKNRIPFAQGFLQNLDYRRKYVRILINQPQSIEERVITLLHELLHIDPERDPRRCRSPYVRLDLEIAINLFFARNTHLNPENLRHDSIQLSGAIEDSIEYEARSIYNRQPLLIGYLVRRFRLSHHTHSC
mgnify:FL=1